MKKFGKLKVLKEVLQFSQSKYCNQAETVNSPTDFVFKKYAFNFLERLSVPVLIIFFCQSNTKKIGANIWQKIILTNPTSQGFKFIEVIYIYSL